MKLFSMILLTTFICGFSAQAADNKLSTDLSNQTVTTGSNDSPQGWVPLAAFAATGVEFDETLADRDGLGANLRLIGSYYAGSLNWVYDMGLGFEAAELNENNVSSLIGELGARYRFTTAKKWSVGPTFQMNAGNGIGADYGSSSDQVVSFVGGQLMRDFAFGEEYLARVGFKAMTDIGIPDSTANKFLLELQVGQAKGETKVSETHTVQQSEPAEEVISSDEVEQATVAAPVEEQAATPAYETVKLPASVYFVTDAEQIGSRNKERVKKIAEILAANKDDIKSLKIIGYADSRGSAEYNKGLSEKRAETVLEHLTNSGLSANALTAAGAGIDDGKADLRQARRVDLEIEVEADKQKPWMDEIKKINGL